MSVWRNDLAQPLVVVRNATHNVVSDIAWSSDDRHILFTAGECVVAVELESAEVGGNALTEEEMHSHVARRENASKKHVSMIAQPSAALANKAVAVSSLHPSQPQQLQQPQQPHTQPQQLQIQPQQLQTQQLQIQPQQSQSHKRSAETEEAHETAPTTRKRKKQQAAPAQTPSTEPVVVAPTFSLPPLTLTLPCSLPLPSANNTLSLQLVPTTPQPSNSDCTSVTLVQSVSPSNTIQWSWVGQGAVVAGSSTSRFFFAWTRDGLMHTVTTDGRTAVPALFLGSAPAAVCSAGSEEGDRFAVVTTQGRLVVGAINPGGRMLIESDIDISGFTKSEVVGIRVHFADYSVLRLQLDTKERKGEQFTYDLNSRCWFVEQQNVFAYSFYNRDGRSSGLNSPFATNSLLTVRSLLSAHG